MFSRLIALTGLCFILLFTISCKNGNNAQNENDSQTETIDPKDNPSTMGEVIDKMAEDQQNPSGERLSYTVSLGVMPDMNYKEGGMLIGHVNEGKPGHYAGLQKGDIVMKLGENEITDLVSYTKALGTYSEGDNVKVTVRRDDQLMTMLVEF